MRRRALAALLLSAASAASLAASAAHADADPPHLLSRDREAALDAPAPPTLPALAHKQLTYTFEHTSARLEPSSDISTGGAEYAWFLHGALELPLVPRRWYVGTAHDVAAAVIPGAGSAFMVGNPEIWGRGLWSSVLGLSSGGGLGVVLPVPRDPDDVERKVLQTVRVVRPWDVAYFNNLTLTFRPWFDIRHLTGRLMFQLRQGIDWSIRSSGTDLTGRATFYVGYRASDEVGVGLELWEVYELTAQDVPDDKRAAFALSPSVRLLLPGVEPAVSLLVPIATPLRGEVASYYALRLSVGLTFDYPKIASSSR